jgi:hypothetical protein
LQLLSIYSLVLGSGKIGLDYFISGRYFKNNKRQNYYGAYQFNKDA